MPTGRQYFRGEVLIKGNIYLTGLMGAGKSTVGRILAGKMGLVFVDLDRETEALAGVEIPTIFARRGEGYFRRLEERALKAVSRRAAQVVATGGGVVLSGANRCRMKATGTVVCLWAPVEELWRRLGRAGNRPLLDSRDPVGCLEALLREREEAYREADYLVDTQGLTPEEVAEKIVGLLGKGSIGGPGAACAGTTEDEN